jgi:dolichyl-phosphate-mannose-protein mannosyltransferase|tara:strand:+ start:24488 stop:24634 length:147 start_codon:yes stop_codon:yes gene_type:complete
MAAAARTTGADPQAEELRRRNVAASQPAEPVVAQAPVKEKSKEKVRKG